MNVLGKSRHKFFFMDDSYELIRAIKKIINLSGNVLREKHFNKKTLAEKITDQDFDRYKVSPSKIYFDKKNVKKAFEIMLTYLRENPGFGSYNVYLDLKYEDIYYNMFQNMIDKENKEYEDIEKES